MTKSLFKREYKRYNAKEKLALSGPILDTIRNKG